VVDDTGIVIAPTRRHRVVGNAYCNGRISKYKSTIFFDLESLSIGFNT
jgi:hypothetical protein